MDIKTILKRSPSYDGEQTAYYSTSCIWWTSFPTDLGNTMKMGGYPAGMVIHHKDGAETTLGDDHPGLPCCPHCGSLLFQAPLEKFIESAEANPDHYGPKGIDNFVAAYSRNSKSCKNKWF